MRFLWPTTLNSHPTTLTRLGRVLHWLGTAMALSTLAFAAFIAHYYLTNSYYVNDGSGGAYAFQWAVSLGVGAAVTYMSGRALRYIFSGE